MISKEDIEHLKDLARVEFGEAETEKIAHDMSGILSYIDKLKEADVSNVSEMTRSVDIKNAMRVDESLRADPGSTAESIIESFPEGENNYLRVKAILQ